MTVKSCDEVVPKDSAEDKSTTEPLEPSVSNEECSVVVGYDTDASD